MTVLLADRPACAPPPAAAAQKDRFIAFAFAAADLLVEASADGDIWFAAGAFNVRFAAAPEQFIGRKLCDLFAPADRPAIDLALSTTAVRGRLAPVVLRLADAAGTPMVVSGLAMPSGQGAAKGRLCFTIGRLPAVPAPALAAAQPTVAFARMVEERLRGAASGALGLVEVQGWSAAQSAMPPETQRALQAEMVDVLARFGGPGSVAGEIASGRYGLLSNNRTDLEAVAAELETLLRAHPATARTHVHRAELALERDELTGSQAARALRFALTRFAEGGAQATTEAGFSNGLAEFVASAQMRAKAVRSALAGNRFRLAFQPIVSLTDRRVHHYEALLRPIFTPGAVIQTTQDFVTFAEAVGLSEEMDIAVMKQAFSAMASSPTVSVAVNVSGLSMESPSFRDRLTELLGAGVRPGQLLVELTETADIQDVASAAACIAWLRDMGVPICIDDFGAGSAAFRYLREFRVDYVKLDGAYVNGARQNAREHGFLLSMVELANFVGAKVIAEKIEREDEAAMMLDLGVEYGQGWLFGKPGGLPGSLGG